MTTGTVDLLVVDDGTTLRGYDCRDVLRVEEAGEEETGSAGRYRIHLGRLGGAREVRCREVLGSVALTAKQIRPVPEVLSDRLGGEKPWAVGVTDRGICLLF